jgi:hypothetical protein
MTVFSSGERVHREGLCRSDCSINLDSENIPTRSQAYRERACTGRRAALIQRRRLKFTLTEPFSGSIDLGMEKAAPASRFQLAARIP